MKTISDAESNSVPSVGILVRRAREDERIGLPELARASGVSPWQLSRIEAGKIEQPWVETLMRLARGLQRDTAALLVLAQAPESLVGQQLHAARLALIESIASLEPDEYA